MLWAKLSYEKAACKMLVNLTPELLNYHISRSSLTTFFKHNESLWYFTVSEWILEFVLYVQNINRNIWLVSSINSGPWTVAFEALALIRHCSHCKDCTPPHLSRMRSALSFSFQLKHQNFKHIINNIRTPFERSPFKKDVKMIHPNKTTHCLKFNMSLRLLCHRMIEKLNKMISISF